MRYVGDIYRPPSEANSLIVQATIGCSYNKCTFCDMYKGKRFRQRPVEDVLDDLRMARGYYPRVEKIFLADGDALIMKTERIIEILDTIKDFYPECKRVALYASPQSVRLKTDEELKTLKEHGLYIAYLGLESGNDEILELINKGETAQELIKAGQRIKKSGILSSVTVISGLGGTQRWQRHAVDTAKALNAMNPDYIGLLTLMVRENTPMYEQVRSGVIKLLSPLQIAEETRLLLEHMDSPGSVFRMNHASNYLSLRGGLNDDKAAMIARLDAAIEGKTHFKREEYRLL